MEFVSRLNEFALHLYEIFTEDGEDKETNIFFSPLSVYLSLNLLAEGARGETLKELNRALFIPEKEAGQATSECAQFMSKDFFKHDEITIANALFIHNKIETARGFFDMLSSGLYGDSEGYRVDFLERLDVCQKINEWTSSKTNGKIPEIYNVDSLPAEAKMLLANAVYFKGLWKEKFRTVNTSGQKFFMLDGTSDRVPLMQSYGMKGGYADFGNAQLLEMWYEGGNYSMTVLLPKLEEFDTIEGTLTQTIFSKDFVKSYPEDVNVWFPKFEMKTSYDLVSPLNDLGIQQLFEKSADLSRLSPSGLYLVDAFQKAYVRVDEEGTEAAAITGYTGAQGCQGSSKVYDFRADHPFIFFIRHRETEAILFMGRFMKPGREL